MKHGGGGGGGAGTDSTITVAIHEAISRWPEHHRFSYHF